MAAENCLRCDKRVVNVFARKSCPAWVCFKEGMENRKTRIVVGARLALVCNHVCAPPEEIALTCTPTNPAQMMSCERGEMKLGRFADRLPALKMREMRFVFVNSAAYTTVKQKPAPNLKIKINRLKNLYDVKVSLKRILILRYA